MKKISLLKSLAVICLLPALVSAQNTADSFWSPVTENSIKVHGKRQIIPQKYVTVELNGTQLKNKLFSAPNEKNSKNWSKFLHSFITAS